MEWMNADELLIKVSKKLTLEQVERKYMELVKIGLNNTPPVVINDKNEIEDGVKRYLVLVKEGFQNIPIVRVGRIKKTSIHKTPIIPLRKAA
jgi:hypothetical protein